jgi:hypothetical protein
VEIGPARICTCTGGGAGQNGAMRYEQICPVSLASEVLAERWTPLILREIVLFDTTGVPVLSGMSA